jgi:hypothetical protein
MRRNTFTSAYRIRVLLAFSGEDWTYDLGTVMEWNCIEVSVGIALATFTALSCPGSLLRFVASSLSSAMEGLEAPAGSECWRMCFPTAHSPRPRLSDDQLPLRVLAQPC